MMKIFQEDPTFRLLNSSLKAASLRHNTISNNIANVNTPNYKRQLVSFEDQLKSNLKNEKSPVKLRRTHPRHIGLEKEISQPQVIQDNSTSLRTDGNNVDIDMEVALLNENTMRYNTLAQIISKKMSMLSSVIKGGR
ncbi:MAG: flagellar basal body rod protein FlgB [Clostridia bacterium]|nr:flagellar basal body rod protein FlgB [Clostridia bacterium]